MTTQMKALDEYILMVLFVMFVLLLKRVHFLAFFNIYFDVIWTENIAEKELKQGRKFTYDSKHRYTFHLCRCLFRSVILNQKQPRKIENRQNI